MIANFLHKYTLYSIKVSFFYVVVVAFYRYFFIKNEFENYICKNTKFNFLLLKSKYVH